MNKCVWICFAMVWAFLIYAGSVVNDLGRQICELRDQQKRDEQQASYQFSWWYDHSMRDYCRLVHAIGEVYGLTTEDEMCRLIYWSGTITNGMPFAERHLRIRRGLDGDDWPEVKK